MSETNLKDCRDIAEQLRKAAQGYFYSDGTTELQVTTSSGVVSLQDYLPESQDKFLSMADEALYKAKANGRNRVEIYEGNE